MNSQGSFPGIIMLDSASLEDVRTAQDYPYVSGVTTNPSLVAEVSDDPLAHLSRLLAMSDLPIFYQPSHTESSEASNEVDAAIRLDLERVIPKVPPTREYLPLLGRLRGEATPFAITAVYTSAQALIAHELGAGWVIPYVDRARRLLPGGEHLVASLRSVLDRLGSSTRILAASLKSSDQVSSAFLAGADAVTVPLSVVTSLFEHPLTRSAVDEFAAASRSATTGPALGSPQ